MGVEFELKYSAKPEQQEEIRKLYFHDHQRWEMATVYYDTPSQSLSARHITLRCRQENDSSVCTVKTPISGYGRGEWDCECDDIVRAIPILCAKGAPAELAELTGEGVQEVCGARFTRLAARVALGDTQLEIALDRGILTGGGKEEPLCEVEVELKAGNPEHAVAFGLKLQKDFGLISQEKSKFRRALALAKGE